jgi:DNA-binding MarR family transcriptional regulator
MTAPDEARQQRICIVRDFILLVGSSMKRCAEQHQRRCAADFDERRSRMSAQEFAIVLILTEHGTMPVKDIAARLPGISLSTLTRMLDKLEAERFVTRALDPGDRRSFLVSATTKAQAAEEQYKSQVAGVAESLLAGLNAEEQLQFVSLLRKVKCSLKPER